MQIEKRMANCWWGEREDKKRIHCASWERLSRPKEAGRLEFRSLKAINEALLAKQL